MPSKEQEIARRYHVAAIRDTNRYFLIMQASLENTEESPMVESTDTEDEHHLTEDEKAILDDSYERPTSDQLFDKVR